MGFVGPMAFFMLFPPKQTVLPLPAAFIAAANGSRGVRGRAPGPFLFFFAIFISSLMV